MESDTVSVAAVMTGLFSG